MERRIRRGEEGTGRGEEESKAGTKERLRYEGDGEREREGKLELLWDTRVGGGVGRLTG